MLLDGRDAATLTAQARRDTVTVVFQDSYLFQGTIADNLRVGNPDARALLKPAPVLLVDEATSALDTRTNEPWSTSSRATRSPGPG